MAAIDRPGLIGRLDDLGAQDDATVLKAARELHAMLRNSGLSWDDLLRPEPATAGDDPAGPELAPAPPAAGPLSPADAAEASRLIERLLARAGLSDTLRGDLTGIKSALGDGSFDASDLRYLRALAKRLGG